MREREREQYKERAREGGRERTGALGIVMLKKP